MKTAHTPGPWIVESVENKGQSTIVDNNDHLVAEVYSDSCNQLEEDANARLIAAAPDMLNVLKRVKIIWDREGIGSSERESEPLYRDLCTAIAKANGQNGTE
jgi:hypothetical protein